jgi:pimeloyl-ACP methyl ester carboxylesterase
MNMPFVREQGVGPDVVCFHSNCSSSGQFKALMDTLGSHFHVTAFDAYGAGKTPAWSQSSRLSLSDEVALAETVMPQAGEQVILIGHSYGAAVALMTALANPARVSAMVVYEPTLFSVVNQVHAPPNGVDAMRVVWKASAQAIESGDPDTAARLFIDFWSGEVEIGTCVSKIGNSSITLYQRVFQNGVCVASADSVVVQMNTTTRRSQALSETARSALSAFLRQSEKD